MPCREAVCTIFMMVFGMTRQRGELTTYRARGRHATDWANPTRLHYKVIIRIKAMDGHHDDINVLSRNVDWLVVFYVPSTARSFRDGTPIYCPLRRTWSSVNTPFPPGIEPRAVSWQSITLPLRHASSTPETLKATNDNLKQNSHILAVFLLYVCFFIEQ